MRPLAAVVERSPWHGSLIFAADGSFTYTPLPGFTGQDTFTYRATDGNTFSAPAEVAIHVAAATPASGLPAPFGFASTLPGSALPGSTLRGSVQLTGSQGTTYSPGGLSVPGDVNGDGRVDRADLAAVVNAYGTLAGSASYHAAADLNGDGRVSLADAIVLRNRMTGFHEPASSSALLRRTTDNLPIGRAIGSISATTTRTGAAAVDEVHTLRETTLRVARSGKNRRAGRSAIGVMSYATSDRVFGNGIELAQPLVARRTGIGGGGRAPAFD